MDRLDASGNPQTITAFDAYGTEHAAYGTPSDPFGYNARSGYYQDRETGLYLCQHRFYDPNNGRWLNRDPIGYWGGTNIYGYCWGDPVGRVDKSGAWWVGICVGFAVMFVLAGTDPSLCIGIDGRGHPGVSVQGTVDVGLGIGGTGGVSLVGGSGNLTTGPAAGIHGLAMAGAGPDVAVSGDYYPKCEDNADGGFDLQIGKAGTGVWGAGLMGGLSGSYTWDLGGRL